jgi:hypothetical protein
VLDRQAAAKKPHNASSAVESISRRACLVKT